MRRIQLLARAVDVVSAAAEHTVNELQFLAGHWTGRQGTGQVEEISSHPANGSMIGMYREMRDGKTTFYEFLSIEQEASGPVMRMKHFKANLIGLEDKDESVPFDHNPLLTVWPCSSSQQRETDQHLLPADRSIEATRRPRPRARRQTRARRVHYYLAP